MEFTDILKTNLYISRILSVVKSQRSGAEYKKLSVKGRHSDAFIFVLSGSCRYECRGSAPFCAKSGDVIYLAKGAEYTMRHENDDLFSFIFCDFEFASDEARECACIQTLENADVRDLFPKLLKSFRKATPAANADCLSILYRIYSDIITLSERAYISSPATAKVKEVKSVIDESFTSPELSVESLAKQAGVSEVYLRRLFNSEFGISPSQYIIAKRIANAEALMKEKTISIEECAKQSGFSSLQYFCRIYKSKKGFTPGKSR